MAADDPSLYAAGAVLVICFSIMGVLWWLSRKGGK